MVKIEIGFQVGMLTVVAPTNERKNGYMVWKCQCACGAECLLDTRSLQRGKITDCGCKTKIPVGVNDLTGKRFGKLVVMSVTEKREYGTVVWKCHCDCGNEAYVSSKQLQTGYTKSCGCLSHPPRKDYIGKQFGKLTVLSYEEKREGMHYWRCRCECGNETVVGQTLLQSGKTKSCGCLQKSIVLENMKFIDGTSVTMLEAVKSKCISNNTSGYNGVYYDKRRGKWVAQITFKHKKYYLGSFDKIEDAVNARKKGEEMYDEFLEWYYKSYDRN